MSSWGKEDPIEDEGSDNEADIYKTANDHLIFLIDGRSHMFHTNQRNETFIITAMRVALSVMKSKIISSDKDSVGIIIFGVENKNSSSGDMGTDRVLNFLPLGVPSADRILNLKNLIDDPSQLQKVIKSQPSTDRVCPLKEALWLCNQSFNVKGGVAVKNTDYKRVWIFTNDDCPNAGDLVEQQSIVQVAKDGAETGLEISLWHMDLYPGVPFKVSAFYSQLLTLNEESTTEEAEYEHRVMGAGSAGGFDEMLDLAKRKEHRKRRLGTMRMYISSGLSKSPSSENPNGNRKDSQIAVAMYKTILPAARPNHVWLQASTSEPAKVSSNYIDTTTGQVLSTETECANPAISTYIDVAGARVPFSKEDMKACRMLEVETEPLTRASESRSEDAEGDESEAQLKVLFFTPASSLNIEMNITSPIMICPDDSAVKGSSSLFTSIAHHMVSRGLIGVGAFCRSRSSMPRLVAMMTHIEENPDSGDSTYDITGMNLVTIPYSNEVRSLVSMNSGAVTCDPVSQEEEDVAVSLVKAMQFEDNFDYRDLQNPAIQHIYSVIQAVALNQETPEWNPATDDMLQPDSEGLDSHRGLLDKLKALSGAHWDGEFKAARSKRAPSGSSGGAPKKSKGSLPVDANGDIDVAVLRTMASEEMLLGETVVNLKKICASLGIPQSGAKAVLVNRIMGALL